jgi:hypothetical protein
MCLAQPGGTGRNGLAWNQRTGPPAKCLPSNNAATSGAPMSFPSGLQVPITETDLSFDQADSAWWAAAGSAPGYFISPFQPSLRHSSII